LSKWSPAVKVLSLAVVAAAYLALAARSSHPSSAEGESAVVSRGPLTADLSLAGVLEPAASITYRSPLIGRDTEITLLAPEGVAVGQGDLLIRLDSTELSAELMRTQQAQREASIGVEMARLDVQQTEADGGAGTVGESALTMDEAQINLRLAERRFERLRSEANGLKPLFDRGFITKEELDRATAEADEADAASQLARRRLQVLTSHSQPRDKTRAELALAQKRAQLENVRHKLAELDAMITTIRSAIDSCSLYAAKAGLVVYETFSGATPSRKIRPGDRVTSTQAIISIPEVGRMRMLTAVRESDVRLVSIGQRAGIAVEAYPDRAFTGRVAGIGTVARQSPEHPQDDKRFDVILDVDPNSAPLRPQMTARADIHVVSETNTLLVPINAVLDEQGQTSVYVVDGWSHVSRRTVKVGHVDGVHASIEQGLNEGERVRLLDAAHPQ
jgi:multidrug efflux pump subunit AcrA (membrane-fusion protein)